MNVQKAAQAFRDSLASDLKAKYMKDCADRQKRYEEDMARYEAGYEEEMKVMDESFSNNAAAFIAKYMHLPPPANEGASPTPPANEDMETSPATTTQSRKRYSPAANGIIETGGIQVNGTDGGNAVNGVNGAGPSSKRARTEDHSASDDSQQRQEGSQRRVRFSLDLENGSSPNNGESQLERGGSRSKRPRTSSIRTPSKDRASSRDGAQQNGTNGTNASSSRQTQQQSNGTPSQRQTGTNQPIELQFCEAVLKELSATEGPVSIYNSIFLQPVDEVEEPEYYRLIKQPMDLSTMANKLSEDRYPNAEAFKADFDLMIKNCQQFHQQPGATRNCAVALKRQFDSSWKGRKRWERGHRLSADARTGFDEDDEEGEEDGEAHNE